MEQHNQKKLVCQEKIRLLSEYRISDIKNVKKLKAHQNMSLEYLIIATNNADASISIILFPTQNRD